MARRVDGHDSLPPVSRVHFLLLYSHLHLRRPFHRGVASGRRMTLTSRAWLAAGRRPLGAEDPRTRDGATFDHRTVTSSQTRLASVTLVTLGRGPSLPLPHCNGHDFIGQNVSIATRDNHSQLHPSTSNSSVAGRFVSTTKAFCGVYSLFLEAAGLFMVSPRPVDGAAHDNKTDSNLSA